jgi:hypothetical protein
MPYDPTTRAFIRVANSFSNPILGTEIDPTDADGLFDDYDTALTLLNGQRTVTAAGVVNVLTTDSRVLINKTVGAATSVVMPSSVTVVNPILIKDLKRDASTNNITVTFTGGQLADGLASVVIATDGGAYWFNPLASGGWYLTTG